MQAEYGNRLRATNGAPLATTHPRLWQRFSRQYEQLLTLGRRTRRALVRRWGLSLAGIALALTLGLAGPSAAAPSATITADGTTCTLIDAITAANSDTAAGSGADTIEVTADVVLTAPYAGDNALPVVTSPMTIEGNGHTISSTYVGDARLFSVTGAGDLTLNNATLSGGRAYFGGGVLVEGGGQVSINSSTLTGNHGHIGGAIFAGGNATLVVTASTLYDNTCARSGCAISTNNALVTVTNSTLSGNSGGYFGGGAIYMSGGLFGGVTLNSTTITDNYSNSGYSGGLYGFNGGAFVINNSIVAGNRGLGGLQDIGGNMPVTAYDSVLGDNSKTTAQSIKPLEAASSGNRFATSDGDTPTHIGDILAVLADNGGPTLTHNLVAGSPAIDIAATGPATDQRGTARPVTNNRAGDFDAGAVEFVASNAIELARLEATALPSGGVRLTWETASEIDSAGFNILRGRSADGADRQALNGALIAATGANGLGAAYTFDDTTAGVGTWHYWLEEIDTRGRSTLHGPVSAEVRVPTAVTLRGVGTNNGIGAVWGASMLVVATLVAFLRTVRSNDFSRSSGLTTAHNPTIKAGGRHGSEETAEAVTTNQYTPPAVTTLAGDDLAANLGAARAFSPRGWDDEL